MEAVGIERTPADGTLAARLAHARNRGFVGREAELDLVRELLDEDPPSAAVVFIHGPGGIGKSSLLRRIGSEVEERGYVAALVDGRAAGAGPAAFTAALAASLGLPAMADPIAVLHAGTRAVLLIDGFDALGGIDAWLRDRLLPQLPANTLTMVASRQPPGSDWTTEPGWRELTRSVALRNLAPAEAHRFLRERAVPDEAADALLQVVGGYPLALTLLAEVVGQSTSPPSSLRAVPDVVQALVQRFVDDVPTAAHREALHVAAHARTTTVGLLRDTVGGADADALFAWLRDRPFMEPGPTGLVPHDVAREALEADLWWRDEDGFRDLHRRVREHVLAELQHSNPSRRRDAFAALMYLHRHNPVYARAATWSGRSLTPRVASSEQRQDAAAVMSGHGFPRTASLLRAWGERQPDAVVSYLDHDGVPAGFSLMLRVDHDGSSRADEPDDPVLRSVLDHIAETAPLRPGEWALVDRMLISRERAMEPSAVMDAHDEMLTAQSIGSPQPAMTLVSLPMPDAAPWEPVLTYIDWGRLPIDPVVDDGREWVWFGHDWRVTPPAVWLEIMEERELGDDLDLDALRRGPVPQLVVLSREEFDAAVREAMRDVQRPARLGSSPLIRSRLVVDLAAADPVAGLTSLLEDATDALRSQPSGDKWHRAVAATYFKGAPTQEAAAERLGLPFSTYRRHLAAGLEAIAQSLWERELHGLTGWA